MATFVCSDGTPIHYLRKGDETDCRILFLHGWCANGLEWLPFAEQLGKCYQTLCWNARGHGRLSIPDNTDMNLSRMAKDLEELLIHEGGSNWILVGHSMGALTAWKYLQQYGQNRLAGLVVIDQSPKLVTDNGWSMGIYGDFDHQRNQAFVERMKSNFSDTVIRLICARLSNRPLDESNFLIRLKSYLDSLPAELMIRCWQDLSQADLRSGLANITVPSLLLYGSESQFYSHKLSLWVQKQISNSHLIHYPQADHSPHFSDAEQMFADISTFVSGLESKRNPEPATPAPNSNNDFQICEKTAFVPQSA